MQCETRLHRFVTSLGLSSSRLNDDNVNTLENGYDSEPNEYAEENSVVVIDPSKIYESDEENADVDIAPTVETKNNDANGITNDLQNEDDNSLLSTVTAVARSATVKRRNSGDTPEVFRNVHFCQFCESAFVDRDQCLAHEVNNHDPYTPHVCNFCSYRCGSRTSIIAHIKECHEPEKPFVCVQVQCNKKFGRRSDLRKHAICHTGVRPFQCDKCDKSFSRNSNLSKHIRVHQSAQSFVCAQCSKSFKSAIDLHRHEAVHDASKKNFQCSKCPARFTRRDKLMHHERGHLRRELMGRANDPKSMIIDLDPFLGNDYHQLQTAFMKAQAAAVTIGTQPPMSALKNALLGNPMHVLQSQPIHPPPRPENGSLAHPSNAPAAKSLLPKNKRAPTKSFACEQCPKRFNKLSSLNNHRAVHLRGKPVTNANASQAITFKCTVCPKSFKNKRELDRHSVVHSGIRSFQCLTCFARFARKDKLVRHEKTHTEHPTNNASCPIVPIQPVNQFPVHAQQLPATIPMLSNPQMHMLHMAPRPNFYINNESLYSDQNDVRNDIM